MKKLFFAMCFLWGCEDPPPPPSPPQRPDIGECWTNTPGYSECVRNSPCQDSSTLLATTAGSPDAFSCDNKNHRMRAETVTKAGEEIGALVICECIRPESKPEIKPEPKVE